MQGVRVYTPVMPITSTTPFVLGQPARLVIDCSRMFQAGTEEHKETEVKSLIAWVSSIPQRSNIHVVLGGYRDHNATRRLHSRLQALGCTVIARHNARKEA
jgi:hypothetical protein